MNNVKWYPVSDGLPEEGVEVAVLYRDESERAASVGVVDPDERWILATENGDVSEDVTHWYPLPPFSVTAFPVEAVPISKVA